MRVTIVYVPSGGARALGAASEALAGGLRARGHEVEVHGAERGELPRLAMSDYLIIGTAPLGLGGKIPPRVAELLAQARGLSGKRSMAFVLRRGPFGGRALGRLMKVMEAEGMSVNYGEEIKGAAQAAALVEGIPLERQR